MCGITTVICKKNQMNASHILMSSLYQLQNRGYDSFGIMTEVNINKTIAIDKMACLTIKDTFENFREKNINIKTNIATGHTRWATHGIISEKNSHPHYSKENIFYLVHNGIIENYIELKELLIEEKYTFYSDTDSEVIVNLIHFFYNILETKNPNNKENIFRAILNATNKLNGTYGLVIQCIYDLGSVYIIRKGSPIIIGENEDYIIATSEQSGFVNQFKSFNILEDNKLIKLSINKTGEITNLNSNLNSNNYIETTDIILTPHPYNHWLIKEIMEQEQSLNRSFNNGARINNNNIKLGGVEYILPHIDDIDSLILLGCGTSLNACNIASFYFKQLRSVNNIYCFDAAEFVLQDLPLHHNKSLIILSSQSGETMDLYRVLTMLKTLDKSNYITMGVINVVDSLIAREVDCGIYLNAGREVSVASTKSFTSSLSILKIFSIWLYENKTKKKCIEDVFKNIKNISEQVRIINNSFENLISESNLNLLNHSNMFILGKGKMEHIAKETALKMKEICYIHAEGYSGSALKHGPFALLEKNFPVILIINKDTKDKMLNVYKEIECRKASILVLTELLDLPVKNVIIVPENNELQEILFIVLLQHIIYKLSLIRGINPDKPRNLAKVVTVE